MQLSTSIQINTSAEAIWNILLDYKNYAKWNPFIQSISGKALEGERLEVHIQNMQFTPTLLKCTPKSELRWLGKLGMTGIFDGEHYFKIEALEADKCIFHHGENFRGVLVPFFRKKLNKETKAGFIEMNEALKRKAES